MRSSDGSMVVWSRSMWSSSSRNTSVFSVSSSSSRSRTAWASVDVAADERVERVAEHVLRDLRHPRDVDQFLDRRMLQVAGHGFGDVDRQIADAFEVGVDLDRGDDGAQVDGHRLVQRQQLEAAVVDLDVQLVDRRVADQHLFDERVVAIDQGAHGRPRPVLGEAAHLEQPCLELFELVLKMRRVTFRRHGCPD